MPRNALSGYANRQRPLFPDTALCTSERSGSCGNRYVLEECNRVLCNARNPDHLTWCNLCVLVCTTAITSLAETFNSLHGMSRIRITTVPNACCLPVTPKHHVIHVLKHIKLESSQLLLKISEVNQC